MAVYASLLSTIPMPQQNWQTKDNTPAAASIKVSDVADDRPSDDTSKSFISRYLDNLKEKMLQSRLKKLEAIPAEKLSPNQQAELEANKQSLNYMV